MLILVLRLRFISCCFFINAHSLHTNLKMDDFHKYIMINGLHIICVSETWLHDGISDSEIYMPGFMNYRKDGNCFKSGKGGGVIYLCS